MFAQHLQHVTYAPSVYMVITLYPNKYASLIAEANVTYLVCVAQGSEFCLQLLGCRVTLGELLL